MLDLDFIEVSFEIPLTGLCVYLSGALVVRFFTTPVHEELKILFHEKSNPEIYAGAS